MVENNIPMPTVMPVNRETWFNQLNLSNFINSYYQFRDLQQFEDCHKVLIVGPGQGLDTQILKWRGYQVTTLDIDDTFLPDYVGSIHDMSMFADGEFDIIIASHVLEHLALPYFNQALGEIARVSRHALIYLPVNGLHLQIKFIPGLFGWNWSWILDICKWFRKPSDSVAQFMEGQHYWEIGLRGCSVKAISKRMQDYFELRCVYRNHDWLPSMNFVLSSRRHSLSVSNRL